ncbi:MAG: class B sortase [Clostridia bacterium]|nr:class B sortase [Clostridia bacterium]
MSDKEKDFEENKIEENNVEEKEETFEDIFSSLREKYNLQPFGSEEKAVEEEEKVFYNPEEDSEIEDFFKSREDDYTALYEEVDAKLAGVDDEALKKEAEVFNLEFKKENKEEAPSEEMVFEDVYSQSEESAEDEYEDIYSGRTDDDEDEEEENYPADIPISVPVAEEKDEPAPIDVTSAVSEEDEKEIPAEYQETEDVQPVAEAEEEINDEAAPVMAENAENLENFDDAEDNKKKKKNKKNKSGILPKKNDSVGEVIRKIVFIISILALIGSAGWLINDYVVQPYLISRENSEIAEFIAPDAKPEEIVEKLNNISEEEKTVTFDALKEINPDFKGWLVVPGADINLPVVKGKNNDKYLNTGFKGKWSPGGTAFIDYQNNLPFSDRNTIIYGHNMRDGSMFGSIKNYKDINTFKKNPYIYIYTENGDYVYKIFSVFLTNANPADDCGYVFGYTFKNLSTEENFAGFMEDARLRSYYNTGVDYEAGDKIVTLSTCDRTVIKDGRLVVVARLVRENEDEAVDTSIAAVNKNQRFPDAWYVKKKKTNPYKDMVRWVAQ